MRKRNKKFIFNCCWATSVFWRIPESCLVVCARARGGKRYLDYFPLLRGVEPQQLASGLRGGASCELVEIYVDPWWGWQQMVGWKQGFLLEGLGKIINSIGKAEADSILGWVTARLSRWKVLGRHACMYTCISTHAYVHIDINICIHICTDMHTHIYVYICIYTHRYMHSHIHMSDKCTWIHVRTNIQTYLYVYVHMSTCTERHIHEHMHTYTDTNGCMYFHTYMCKHVHRHTDMHTHTHKKNAMGKCTDQPQKNLKQHQYQVQI